MGPDRFAEDDRQHGDNQGVAQHYKNPRFPLAFMAISKCMGKIAAEKKESEHIKIVGELLVNLQKAAEEKGEEEGQTIGRLHR